MTARGQLRVYLGAAPGVGKTYKMLEEAHRRARPRHRRRGRLRRDPRPAAHRGPARRPGGGAPPDDVLPGRRVHRDGPGRGAGAPPRRSPWSTSWPTPTCPARRHEKRWQDIEELLDAGITVITTVNIQHLESLNDVVQEITGVAAAGDRARRGRPPRRPDRAGRHDPGGAAPPDGARQHLRPGQGRRRAGQLLPGRQPHRAARARPAVAGRQGRRPARPVPRRPPHHRHLGGPGTGRRRADRRARGRHPDPPGAPGSPTAPRAPTCSRCTSPAATAWPAPDPAHLARQRVLVESLGGTYHQVLGSDIPTRAAGFRPRGERHPARPRRQPAGPVRPAVLPRRRRHHHRRIRRDRRAPGDPRARPNPAHRIGRLALGGGAVPPPPGRPGSSWPWSGCRCSPSGWIGSAGNSACPATSLRCCSGWLRVALVGGLWPALVAAVAGFLLLNYFFVPPLHQFTIAEAREPPRAAGVPAGRGRRSAWWWTWPPGGPARPPGRRPRRPPCPPWPAACCAGSGRCPRCWSRSGRRSGWTA